ncbi:hypothetical protein DTO027B5_3552 [Paecilomyces variotii]|nr:hypothetical protein DTO021C3_9184 [Paecilomyces variotii]KAJ9327901.1 hypothetical protein DTO027B3_1609 [Paecilomyces variotii]KAJ9334755.1 hypothetical protein DTO027B5_3552 [Paecilomyces variotii]
MILRVLVDLKGEEQPTCRIWTAVLAPFSQSHVVSCVIGTPLFPQKKKTSKILLLLPFSFLTSDSSSSNHSSSNNDDDNNNNNNSSDSMGKLAKTLPVGAKKAAWGDKQQQQQQQQPQASQPVRPLQPSAAPTGKLTRAEKKRKRLEAEAVEARKRGHAEYRAELASKGIFVPPDMMQPEKPARTLTPGQQLRKQELCAALVESKGSLKTLKAIKRGLTKALGDFEQKLREQEGLHGEIITELKTLS